MWWASAVLADPRTSASGVAPRARACSSSSSTRTPAPSAMTKPSRSRSKGRDTPVVLSAVMFSKPATPVWVMALSVPPVRTALQRPVAMSRAALPMEWVPAAQAVTVVSQGPRKPWRMEMPAAAAFGISIGMRNGDTRSGPRTRLTSTWSSRVCRPPMPVPTSTPIRSGSPPGSPDWSRARLAAPAASCVKRSARRASLGPSNQGSGSQSWISRVLPTWAGPSRAAQKASAPMPTADTTPTPVTTTRRPSMVRAWSGRGRRPGPRW